MFECDKCGLCCVGLEKNEATNDMHDGDGVCKNLNLEDMSCNIYEDRPIFCRIDDGYDMYFKDIMSKEAFYQLNYNACEKKKKELRDNGGNIYLVGHGENEIPREYDEALSGCLEEINIKD